MSEHSVAQAKASVMLYNNETKKWEPSGGSQGISKIQVYHHPVNNTYRIVGRKIANHDVVINCALARGLKYNKATPTFHQWRDQRQVYGLNFSTRDDADGFANAVTLALEDLASVAQQSSTHHPPQQQPQQSYRGPSSTQNYQSHFQQHNEIISNGQDNDQEDSGYSQIRQTRPSQSDYEPQDHYQRSHSSSSNRSHYDIQVEPDSESVNTSQVSVASISSSGPSSTAHSQVSVVAPPAPPAPPAPAPPVAPAAPPAPPAPPLGGGPPAPPLGGGPPAPPVGGGPPAPPLGGGPPAPPPPPPGPSPGGGGSLADQIAAAKLKKAKATNEGELRSDRSMSTSRAPVSSFGKGDVMAEMARKLAARRAKEEGETSNVAPVREEPDTRQEKLLSSSRTNNGSSPSNKANLTPAPKPSSNNLKVERANSSSRNESVSYNEEIEQLKNELLAEFKRELDIAKREIIEAVRQEMARFR